MALRMFNSEAERYKLLSVSLIISSLINLSTIECGAGFTTKLEGMFKDMDTSKDIMVNFRVRVGPENNVCSRRCWLKGLQGFST